MKNVRRMVCYELVDRAYIKGFASVATMVNVRVNVCGRFANERINKRICENIQREIYDLIA